MKNIKINGLVGMAFVALSLSGLIMIMQNLITLLMARA